MKMNPYSPDSPAGPPDGPHSDPLIGSHLVRLPMTILAAYTLGMVNPGRGPDTVQLRTGHQQNSDSVPCGWLTGAAICCLSSRLHVAVVSEAAGAAEVVAPQPYRVVPSLSVNPSGPAWAEAASVGRV